MAMFSWQKQNNLDAVFGLVFFFVSDTAHSCWITGFNRLLLCSIVFQILHPVFRTCCSPCRLKNLIPKHCIALLEIRHWLISVAEQTYWILCHLKCCCFLCLQVAGHFSNVPYYFSFNCYVYGMFDKFSLEKKLL